MTTNLTETTIRDFGGGWNISDSDKSLTSKYQVISDNVVRQTDGSFSIRPGTRLFADLKQGVEATVTSRTVTANTTAGSGWVKITNTAHGLTSGMHINITAWSLAVGGILTTDFIGNFGVKVDDANNYWIYVRKAGVTIDTKSPVISYVSDTHMLGGKDIFGRYYKDNLFVFSDTGEIVAVDKTRTVTQVWNAAKAAALTLAPWGPCKRVSAEIVRGKMIAVNGAINDKPLEINGTVANYLVDAATLSNVNIPRADFVIAADQFVLLISTEFGSTKVDISAENTTGTFQHGGGSTGNAVEVDIGMVTQSVDTTILGANVIRSRVFIGFHDRAILGTLAIFNTAVPPAHKPEFKDNVAQFGTFSHASIISLGNDLLCAGLNGINSLEISKASGEYTPTTISDFVHPVMLRHFARLSEDDRRYRTFAVWDVNYRSYMLFAPKYSDSEYTMPEDPVIVSDTLQQNNLCFLTFPSHIVDAGDWVDISGAVTGTDPAVPASIINGRRRIRAVYDNNTLVIECGAYPVGKNLSFGGTAVKVKPVNDESPVYVYEYNSRLKITRWTRFRGMDYDWGAISQLNRLFFGKNGRVYLYGNNTEKFSADKVGDYTKKVWANSTTYTAGDRLLDASVVYLCLVTHTSPSTGTFKQYREAVATRSHWEVFKGFPINWEMESAWTDFKERKTNKQIEIVSFDTEGSSDFEFSIYTDTIRTDFESFDLIPNRTTIFIGQDAPGFGAGSQPFGGGRNTRQEWLRGIPVYGKLFRLRFAGSSVLPLQINAVSLYYHKSKVLT
jgi:hypothetical protein